MELSDTPRPVGLVPGGCGVPDNFYDSVAKELQKIPEIVRLNYTTGNYSMFAEIVCKDILGLRAVLHGNLQKIKGIERTETFISLDESFNRNVKVIEE